MQNCLLALGVLSVGLGLVSMVLILVRPGVGLYDEDKWYYSESDIQIAYACKTITLNGTCLAPFELFEGSCYQLVDTKVVVEEAELACKAMSSFLVSIHSDAENHYINSLRQQAKVRLCWIGLSRSSSDDWSWNDGSIFDYAAWARARGRNRGHFKDFGNRVVLGYVNQTPIRDVVLFALPLVPFVMMACAFYFRNAGMLHCAVVLDGVCACGCCLFFAMTLVIVENDPEWFTARIIMYGLQAVCYATIVFLRFCLSGDEFKWNAVGENPPAPFPTAVQYPQPQTVGSLGST